MDTAPLDALIKFLEEAPSKGYAFNSNHLSYLALLRALLVNPPQEIVEDGRLKKLESLASHVGNLFASLRLGIRSPLVAADLNQQLKRALDPMRDWRLSYSLVPGKESVTQKAIDLDCLLKETCNSRFMSSRKKEVAEDFEILRESLVDFPKLFMNKFSSLKRELGSISDLYNNQKKNKERPQRFYMRLIETFHSKGYMHLFDYYQHQVEKLKPSVIYFPRTGQLSFIDHLVENIEELVKCKSDKIGPLKPYILPFKKMLESLSSSIKELEEFPEPQKEDALLKDRMKRIADLAQEVEFAIDSFLVEDIPLWFCMFWLRDVLKQGKLVTEEVKMDSGDTYSIVSSVNNLASKVLTMIPIVSETGISENLMEVLNHPTISLFFKIRSWCLVSSYKGRKMEAFFELLGNASYEEVDLKEDERELIEGAYERNMSEDELKASLRRLLKKKRYFIILEDVRDIDTLKDIISILPENFKKSRVILTTPSAELAVQCRYRSREVLFNTKSKDNSSTSQIDKPTFDDDVVGFKEETEMMLQQLTGVSKQLRIISVVGMAGQGKTTLTKKLYSHPSIVNYFDTCSWCHISQVYNNRELLLELLGQVVQLCDTIRHKDDVELAHMLCNSLRGRRFLIVLDDIWSIKAWNDLRRCFPNDNNGSRIIFTTRLKLLASQAQSNSLTHHLGPLSDNESLELLRKKLFQKESYPSKLLGAAIQIAKGCKGLPVSIVLIAGLLAKMENKENQWKEVAKSLSSRILGDTKELGKDVIELSYKHLPEHLKPCFLYFGAFLDDREVPIPKLIRLWIAEGFIRYTKLKSLEDVAEDYLMDLIARSLVTVAQEKSNGRVKSCYVHDLLRDFCLRKATEENFLQLINGYDKQFPSSIDLDYGVDPNYSYPSKSIRYCTRRLCIYSKRNHFIMLKPFGPFVRSLLFFAANDTCPNHSYDISFISHNFKLLRVLDLEHINIGDCFKVIEVLVHLRYLAVHGNIEFVPSSIANLWNLETLLVKGLRAKGVKVPDTILDMVKLRHVHINDAVSFDLEPHRLENSSLLDNLQTFSTPSLSHGDNMEKIVKRMPRVRKLNCIFLDSWDDTKNCNQFPELGNLSQLVSLKVFYKGEGRYPCKFDFPSNLKKLTLSNFRMPWDEISQLALLKNLEVLKLCKNAFEGEIWEMEEDVAFGELKFLGLDTLDVVKWSAFSGNFPCLQRLLLHKCEQLEEIPQDIGDISTLEMIQVMWCSPSVATSARKIQEEQLQYVEEFKVHIHPKVRDFE